MIKVKFYRKWGAGSRDGYVLRYQTAFGMLPLLNAEGKNEVFSKAEVHRSSESADALGKHHKVFQAMTSTAWSMI